MGARPTRRRLPAFEEISRTSEFPTQPIAFSHDLHVDPRLTLESIADLAERLPESVVCDVAAQGLLVPRGGPPKGALAQPGDVIRNLRDNNSWLTLLNVEQDPSYAELMTTALDQLERGIRRRDGEMRQRAAFILVSSPSSVTPVHFDIEHSLLVQLSGSKRVTIGYFESAAAQRHEVERYFDGSHGRMESIPEVQGIVDLEPGTGVFIPAQVPHWVHNDPAISTSITLTFFTAATQRACRIEDLNARLRRLHLDPRPPGESEAVDVTKAAVIGAWRLGAQVRTAVAGVRGRNRSGDRAPVLTGRDPLG